LSDRAVRPGPDLVGAGLVALAAACFGTLGPLSRFAGDAGVDSLSLVTWRAAIGAGVVTLYITYRLLSDRWRSRDFRYVTAGSCWRRLLRT
jgi:hypothetical protein